MKLKIILSAFLLLCSCSTLNDSMVLGATIGLVTTVGATSAANNKTGHNVTDKELSSAAGLGVVLGIITSYLIHNDIAEKRSDSYLLPEIYFGDLPPSPFIMTPSSNKKGRK